MAILATQRVLTHDYWKFAHDLAPGDVVFDQHGKPVRITLAQTYRSTRCYEITLCDHLTICGDDKLKLALEDLRYRLRSNHYKGVHPFRRPLKVKSIAQLLEEPLRDRLNRHNHSIPTTKPIQLAHQTLPVPPFVFGYWFFNVTKRGKLGTTPQTKDVVYEKFRNSGYKIEEFSKSRSGEPFFKTSPTIVSHLVPHIPTKIPNNYLLGSAEQRFELLQGILMAKRNSYNQKQKRFRFSHKNKLLVTQVQYLAESLGCKTAPYFDPTRQTHTVFIRTKMQIFPWHEYKPHVRHFSRRFVTQIDPLPDQLCVHLETDGPDQTILVGEGFIACL